MENKAIIQHYLNRVWEDQDFSAVDEIFCDDTIIHSPFKLTKGAAAMKEIIGRWLEVFPDLTCYWDDFIAEDDKVVSRWHAVGTHMGALFDTSPTHTEVCYGGVTTYALTNGKVTEYWNLVDLHAIFKQLEVEQTLA